jgi:hypothetical protein
MEEHCFLVFEQGVADVERGELDNHGAGITILGWDGKSLVDGEIDERNGVGVNVTWLFRLATRPTSVISFQYRSILVYRAGTHC